MKVRFLAGLLLLSGITACQPEETDQPVQRRVLLISIDTLRPDHLSAYGYGRPTSPNLDRFAEDAVLFERAYAQSTWTLPSHMSIFTGLYPIVHGMNDTDRRLAKEIWTLPEILQQDGFKTAGFTDGGYIGGEFGFEDGFDEYWDDYDDPVTGAMGLTKSYPRVESWLQGHLEDSFFLFVHTFDVHGPYRSSGEPFDRFLAEASATEKGKADLAYLKTLGDSDYLELDRFDSLEQVVAAYDGNIVFTDRMLGRLFDRLKELGLYDETMIIVTSDHGESFLDENLYVGHGIFLHDGEVRVPLIVKFPGNLYAGTRQSEVVESIDILPTVLQTLRVPAPENLLSQGTSLLDIVRGRPDPNPVAYAGNTFKLENFALRTKDWTLLSMIPTEFLEHEDGLIPQRMRPRDEAAFRARLRNEHQLMPAGADVRVNVRSENEAVFQSLAKELARWKRVQEDLRKLLADPQRRASLSPKEIKQLKSLGYLGGPSKD